MGMEGVLSNLVKVANILEQPVCCFLFVLFSTMFIDDGNKNTRLMLPSVFNKVLFCTRLWTLEQERD